MEGSCVVSDGGHPYIPKELHLPGYVHGSISMPYVVSVFSFFTLLIVSLTWIFSGRPPKNKKVDRLLMCWWVFTGLTHLIVEGYFVVTPEFYKDNTGFYLADLWKEYSKGDSRYVGRDAGVLSVEALTSVFAGPASLLAVYAIAAGKSYSHILQFGISVGQLYGVGIYYMTALLEGDNFSTSRLYYYAYYIRANVSWIVVPLIIVIRSWKYTCVAFQGRVDKRD
ncbi:hypothetical protein PIB30_028774 [Stylosanthes scabra]|uniref:EXPERA domain-containing protein n=1 Tax=Stylosanthes scabra TaxID=79078 RepID=A0ABU6Z7X2_9FABA|nr:hypothetical protein [Stylosanthes scabra]